MARRADRDGQASRHIRPWATTPPCNRRGRAHCTAVRPVGEGSARCPRSRDSACPLRCAQAAEELKNTVGVVDHGLFCGMTYSVIVAGKEGVYEKKA